VRTGGTALIAETGAQDLERAGIQRLAPLCLAYEEALDGAVVGEDPPASIAGLHSLLVYRDLSRQAAEAARVQDQEALVAEDRGQDALR
jgi:hypothetical protein